MEASRKIYSWLVSSQFALTNIGRRALFLRDRANLLNFRIRATKSKQCAVKDNASVCPEVFLDAVSEKLASMAVLFLDVELISEFHYQV